MRRLRTPATWFQQQHAFNDAISATSAAAVTQDPLLHYCINQQANLTALRQHHARSITHKQPSCATANYDKNLPPRS
jgi:hypothetical protein